MSDTLTLTIPGEPCWSLSPNSRTHWAVKQRETKAAIWSTRYALSWADNSGPISGPVSIHWTVYLPPNAKRRDNDNALPCMKAHQDALVREGVIGGDSPDWIPAMPTVEQVVWSQHRGDARIDVTISAIEARSEGVA